MKNCTYKYYKTKCTTGLKIMCIVIKTWPQALPYNMYVFICSLFVRLAEKTFSKSILFLFTWCLLSLSAGTKHQGLREESFRGVLVHSPVCCTWQRRGMYHKKKSCCYGYNKQFPITVVGTFSQSNIHYRLLALSNFASSSSACCFVSCILKFRVVCQFCKLF